ncbi:hypothetical protein IEQ34_019136 [Dendrobium chrysotoxum]|uniref:Uncharacterized protein n=1 Tax=Dendrobium chrysotoxum TaxID=161865 RepID=A0AAV7G7Z1_DENCH|nr:hypothetical protein IEQ34_019136 [Dendrobium chrysotoxum]
MQDVWFLDKIYLNGLPTMIKICSKIIKYQIYWMPMENGIDYHCKLILVVGKKILDSDVAKVELLAMLSNRDVIQGWMFYSLMKRFGFKMLESLECSQMDVVDFRDMPNLTNHEFNVTKNFPKGLVVNDGQPWSIRIQCWFNASWKMDMAMEGHRQPPSN